jgi:hypothetical protein
MTEDPCNSAVSGVANAKTIVVSRRAKWLLSSLVGLLVLSWILDVPGMWWRWMAERALLQHLPHHALSWTTLADSLRNCADNRLLEARARLQQNQNLAAAESLKIAQQLGAKPDLVEAFGWMIDAQQGDLAAADKLLNSSLDLPIEAYESVLRCNLYNNRLSHAQIIFDSIESTIGNTDWLEYYRGRRNEIAERYEQALTHYVRSYSLLATPRAAFRAGVCYVKLREYPKAIEQFSKITHPPYLTVGNVELANALWENNQQDQARATVRPSLMVSPNTLKMFYLELDEVMDTDRATMVAARIADAEQQSQRAIELLQKAMDYNERDFEARTLLIRNLRIVVRTAEADSLARIQEQLIAAQERLHSLRLELAELPESNQSEYLDKLCEVARLSWYAESSAEALLTVADVLKISPDYPTALQLRQQIVQAEIARKNDSSGPSLPTPLPEAGRG